MIGSRWAVSPMLPTRRLPSRCRRVTSTGAGAPAPKERAMRSTETGRIPPSTVPASPKIYHITHVDNLAAIVGCGGIRSDAQRMDVEPRRRAMAAAI